MGRVTPDIDVSLSAIKLVQGEDKGDWVGRVAPDIDVSLCYKTGSRRGQGRLGGESCSRHRCLSLCYKTGSRRGQGRLSGESCSRHRCLSLL